MKHFLLKLAILASLFTASFSFAQEGSLFKDYDYYFKVEKNTVTPPSGPVFWSGFIDSIYQEVFPYNRQSKKDFYESSTHVYFTFRLNNFEPAIFLNQLRNSPYIEYATILTTTPGDEGDGGGWNGDDE